MDQRVQTSLLTTNSSESSLQPLEASERYHNVTASECTYTARGFQDSNEGCMCERESCAYCTRGSTTHDSDRNSEVDSGDIYDSESNDSTRTRRSRSGSCFDTDFSELMNDPDCDYPSSLSDGPTRRSSLSSSSSSSSEIVEERQVYRPVRRERSSSVYSSTTEALARELGRALEGEQTPPPNPVPSGLIQLSAPRQAQPPIAFPPLPSIPLSSTGPGSSGQQRLSLIPFCLDDLDYDADVETARTPNRLDEELFGHSPRPESFRSIAPLHSAGARSTRAQSDTPPQSVGARMTPPPSERAWSMTPPPPQKSAWVPLPPLALVGRRRDIGQLRPLLPRWHLHRPSAKRKPMTPPPDSDDEDDDEDEDEDEDEDGDGDGDGDEGSAVGDSRSEYIPDSASNSDSENMSLESDVSDSSGDRPKKRRKG